MVVRVEIATPTEVERFLAKTATTEHGLIWTGCVNGDGYPVFRLDGGRKGKTALAHRYWYEYNNGTIPRGMHVDHACFYRRCLTHLQALDAVANRHKYKAHKYRLDSERRIFIPKMMSA